MKPGSCFIASYYSGDVIEKARYMGRGTDAKVFSLYSTAIVT